jgi:hypothetical protein
MSPTLSVIENKMSSVSVAIRLRGTRYSWECDGDSKLTRCYSLHTDESTCIRDQDSRKLMIIYTLIIICLIQ